MREIRHVKVKEIVAEAPGSRIILEAKDPLARCEIPFAKNPSYVYLWKRDQGSFRWRLRWDLSVGRGFLVCYGGAHRVYLTLANRKQVEELVEALKRLLGLLRNGRA